MTHYNSTTGRLDGGTPYYNEVYSLSPMSYMRCGHCAALVGIENTNIHSEFHNALIEDSKQSRMAEDNIVGNIKKLEKRFSDLKDVVKDMHTALDVTIKRIREEYPY